MIKIWLGRRGSAVTISSAKIEEIPSRNASRVRSGTEIVNRIPHHMLPPSSTIAALADEERRS